MKIAIIDADYHKELGNEATARYLAEFEKKYPQIAEKYFDIKWNNKKYKKYSNKYIYKHIKKPYIIGKIHTFI